jgi:hypothetical protein
LPKRCRSRTTALARRDHSFGSRERGRPRRVGWKPPAHGDEPDIEFLTRAAAFIDAVDLHALRLEWGDDAFETVTAYVWGDIRFLVRRITILGDRETAMWHTGRNM